MERNRILHFILSVILIFVLAGCIEKTVYPSVIITVDGVTPFDLTITGYTKGQTNVTLPTVSFSLKVQTQVPSWIKGISITYRTKLDQPLPELEVKEIPFDFFLTPNSANAIEVSPYTLKVLELYDLSSSEITPIKAQVIFRIKDVNGNEVFVQSHCRLHKPTA